MRCIHQLTGILHLMPFLLKIEGISGWGPYTHAAFGSLFYSSLKGLQLYDNHDTSEQIFITANAFPDAFKYERDWMHSLQYAAFQLECAAFWNPKTDGANSWRSSLDFIRTDSVKAFSYGYLLHLLEDYVGHHTRGYLNPKKDHLLEFDVDTLFYKHHKSDSAPWFYRDDGMGFIDQDDFVLQDISYFLANTSTAFAESLNKQVTGLTPQQAKSRIHQFVELLKMERVGFVANKDLYQSGMTRYDVCHAQSFAEANNTLKRTISWTEGCLHLFEKHLFPFSSVRYSPACSPSNRALNASQSAVSWVDRVFKSNGGTICNNQESMSTAKNTRRRHLRGTGGKTETFS